VRSHGVIDKGGPGETETEQLFGWDPVKRSVYYIDFHGDQDVFKGTVMPRESRLELDFERIVGSPARWRATIETPSPDRMVFTLFDPKEGEWVKRFSVEYRRQR